MRPDGLSIEHFQLVGAASGENWSQVRVVVPLNKEELKMRGVLAVVVRVKNVEEAAGVGVEMLQDLVEKFQSEAGVGRWEWVRQAAAWLEEERGEGIVAVMVPVDGKRAMYIAGRGDMVVELQREGNSKLLWGRGQDKAVSGWLQEDDEIMLGTDTFYDKVWSNLDIEVGEERIEEAGTKITSSENGALMAGLVLEVGEMREESEEVAGEIEESREPERKVKRKWAGEGKKKKRSWLNLRKRKSSAVKLFPASKEEWSLRIGVVFLIIFVISVSLGAWRKSKRERLAEFKGVAEPIEYNLQEAQKLLEVNPVRARSLVVEAQKLVEEQGDRFVEGGQEKEWENLVSEVDKVWTEVSGEKTLQADKWLDLSVVKEAVEVREIVVEEDSLWVRDGEDSLLVINLDDKSSQVVAGGEVAGKARALGVLGEAGLVGKDSGVWQVEKSGDVSQAFEIEGINLVDLEGYANNIYVLADEGVFKYPGIEEGFGKRRRYLGAGEEVSVGQVLEMEIDGDIWVLGEKGEVERLSRGQKTNFSLEGMVGEWQEPKGLMVDKERGSVWVWDKGRGEVIEFGREDGQYKHAWKEEKLKDFEVVEWDGERNRLIATEGSQLWVMEIKE